MIDQIQLLSDYTFSGKYAKYLKNKKRRETWEEAVQRSKDMYYSLYSDEEIRKEIDLGFEAYFDKLAIGSNRALQFGGEAILRRNVRTYNCSFSYADRPRFFQESMWCLLAGTGVGFSVQKHHINKLPNFAQPTIENTKTFVIPDSIEGWSDAIGVLLSSYFAYNCPFPEFSGCTVHFDYSQIRSKGTEFSHGIGKAPGHEPLEASIEKIRSLLNRCIKEGFNNLRTIDAYDIVMHISDAVLSGGIRRSSTICLFSIDDDLMINAKTGNWLKENPQRARSNNSAVCVRGKVSREQFHKLFLAARYSGDPGILWTSDEEFGTNPCLSSKTKVFEKSRGLIQISDLRIGDFIWDGVGYTEVLNKWSTGFNQVFEYRAGGDKFVGTENHRIVLNGIKKPIKECKNYDHCPYPYEIKTIGYLTKQIQSPKDLGVQETWDIKVSNESQTFWSEGFTVSNCGEVGLFPKDSKGRSGWQFCNLSSINGAKVKTIKDWAKAVEAATILGTLQASLTKFEYLGEVSEEITRREALLGVSICGMMHNPELFFNADNQKAMAQLAIEVNKRVARKLNINAAARITLEKPDGHTGALLGSSSGVHAAHSKRFIRFAQANELDQLCQFYRKINPKSVERSVWSANQTDMNIKFACELDDKVLFKEQVSAIDFLEKVKLTQMNWVMHGQNIEQCVDKRLHHNVSNTVHIKNHEWDDVEQFIFDNQDYLAGISMLPFMGDKDFEQAPFTSVLTHNEIVSKYGEGALFTSGLIDEALELYNGRLWLACNDLIHENLELKEKASTDHEQLLRNRKIRWQEKIKKFAKKYLDNNIQNTIYLLKDVYLWKIWLDLRKETKRVNFEDCIEESNQTEGTKTVACGGGTCELI